ncbi:MAG: GspE/PulE family protein [Pseudomonadota bacterium]
MQLVTAIPTPGHTIFDAIASHGELAFEDRVRLLSQEHGLTEFAILQEFAQAFGMRAMSAKELEACLPDFERASFAECQRRRCALGGEQEAEQTSFVFITSQPYNLDAQQYFEALIEHQAPDKVIRALVLEADFQNYLENAEKHLHAMDTVTIEDGLNEAEAGSNTVLVLSMSAIEGTSNPTVRLVDSTLYDALKIGASDIHFEVQNKALHIKYRLDGVLQSIKKVDSLDTANQVISRIKVLSDLDISERRIPQDGRFRVTLDQREIDFRVSVMPNISGEDAVLRILDRKHLTGQFESLSLDTLSFEQPVKDFIRQAARLPYGLLLVTGPTGSGKTTTLYAALSEINTGLDKIITIEDPIEYQLNGVLQIPVNEKKGLTFAKGLRSILRHDPDKIMVGEIRDSETAQIAVQAALTGHQVFTTVHANNVFDVIGRFSNMGVDSYSLVAALTGIMAQRLVRTVCQHCAVEADDSEEHNELYAGATRFTQTGSAVFKKAVGCPACRGTGYKGRCAIAETLTIDDAMKDLLVQQAPISTIKGAAREQGFKTLRDSAISLALRGMTTIEEINRVTPIQ